MDSKKRRSSLRKSLAVDMVPTDIKTQINRRISFSGKNSVRVFHGEEEPKTWNNSYEISDHLNVNETASNLCAPPKPTILRSTLKNTNENKENVDHVYITQVEEQIDTNQKNFKNVSISNNISVLSSTKDMINVSYQHQNSKMYQIENSVDITLYEKELKFQGAEVKATTDETTSKLYSFSMEDNEKETRSAMFGERTIDFMRVLQGDTINMRGDNTKDNESVTVFNEYMDEDQYLDKIAKEPVTIYMNDSVSLSGNEHEKSNNKRKTLQDATMQLSPNKTIQYNKENVNPTSMQNADETQNCSCQMEIEDEIFSQPQSIDVNVEKESVAFQEKLNQLSLLQESDNNMQIDKNLHLGNVESKVKPRKTINFNEGIEISPKINSRPTINFNQPIEISPRSTHKISQKKLPTQNMSYRPTTNFIETIELSPKKVNELGYNHICANNIKSRPTINFNLSIEVDSQNDVVDNCAQHGAIPKVKSRPTINFNQPIETSPQRVKTNVTRGTLYLKQDICASPKLSKEPLLSNNLNVPGSIRKDGQLPKLVVRKICTPLANKSKIPVDLEQQRMLRYKKKHEQIVETDKPKDVTTAVTDTEKLPKVDNTLNFSLSSESSSPLIPPEFKVYNLKQLNDEIESGKINVFSNASKTSSTDRKARFAASNFFLKSDQLSQTTTKQKSTLVFDDIDIPISSDDILKTVKSSNVFDFNTTQVVAQDGTNTKFRYSQADDFMLDNTSFLTRAKLSDETVSRNSSKRELTQLNDIMHVFSESIREAASKLDRGITGSSVKSRKLCNKENDTLSSMFQNAKPIFTQTITNIKDMNLYDTMDISHEIVASEDDKHGKNFDDNDLHQRQTLLLNHDIKSRVNPFSSNNINNNLKEIHDQQNNKNSGGSTSRNKEMEIDEHDQNIEKQQVFVEKSTRQTIYFNNDIEEQYLLKGKKPIKQTLYLDEDVDHNNIQLGKYNRDETQLNNKQIRNFETNCGRQTTYLNNDIEESFNTDVPKKDNSLKTTILYDNSVCVNPIETTMYCEGEHKNLQSRKRQTLYPNEDIALEMESDVVHPQEKESIVAHETRRLFEECKIRSRHTTHFGDNNIIDEHFVKLKKLENFENTKNQQTLLYDQKINQDDSIEIREKTSIRIEENVQEEESKLGICNSNATKKTRYFNNKIPLEASTGIKSNVEIEKPDTAISNTNHTKKTYFNSEIPVEESLMRIEDNIKNGKHDTDIQDVNPTGKTMFFNYEIPLEKLFSKDDVDIDNFKSTRKTLYFNNEIPTDKVDTHIQNSNPKRKTLFYSEEVCELNETKTQIIDDNKLCKKVSQCRKSVYITQDMDVTLNEVISGVKDNEQLMDLTLGSLDNKKYGEKGDYANTIKLPPVKKSIQSRKSVYVTQDMDVTLNEVISGVNDKDQTMDLDTGAIDSKKIDEEQDNTNAAKVPLGKKSIHTVEGMDLTLDVEGEWNKEIENENESKSEELANTDCIKDVSLNVGHSKENDTENGEKVAKESEELLTPRLSLLEFIAAEKKTREEERLQSIKYLSPLRSENTNKRLPVNITPVLSIPKKRQSFIFDDCLMDESETSLPAENSIEKVTSCNNKVNDIEESKMQEPFYLSKRTISGQAMEISGIVANDSVLQTPPKQRKSRIPIPISSGKKSNRSFSLIQTSLDHHKDADDKLDMDGDNLAESIQLLRRATTFTQRKYTEIEHNGLEIENEPVKKTSTFEGNPITISDVSVFFEAQRKSNSVGPETEMILPLDKMYKSGIESIEKAKKSLENRYLNLNLEDIDKTHLSLVQISYEDGGVNNTDVSVHEQNENCVENQFPQNDEVISDDGLENNLIWRNRRQSVNYLRNLSVVCRKCKRCQDTLLNETTSSTSESFVLPPLPPTPDLGLERLRRLRKRPAIADVNILWQRVSLDRTIIRALNISDDDSQIISDLDDEADDESSPVTKCIRKYEKDVMSFEMDLLGTQQNKASSEKLLPFVLRLDDLLSANSTNWTFDFQMQYRGILLFTHKQMYTFSVTLIVDEVDPLGHEISLKFVKLEKGHVPEKNWKAIDFVLDFQFKLNLPFDLQSLCEGNNEAGIFKMLQTIDRTCLDTIKMGKQLQRISFTNQASIIRDQFRTYVRKVIRKIVNVNNSDFKYVQKTVIKVELLNLKKLTFRDIVSPPLYNFREEIHLLPTGLQFLQEFLPNPFNYIKHY